MKLLKSNYIHSFLSESQLADVKATFNDMSSVKGGRGLINWFVRISYLIFKKKNPSITRAIFVFLREIHKMRQNNGLKYTVLYLKTAHVSLMQAVGGYRVKDSALISKVRISRSLAGLPRIIPAIHREGIRKGNIPLIRLYSSLFSLYRVLSFESAVSLATIVDPGTKIGEQTIHTWNHVVLF